MSCSVRLPAEFAGALARGPNGETENARYAKAYEAFWWNCVTVKAADLDAGCPTLCSGTPAASLGCLRGAEEAEGQIRQRLATHSRPQVQHYLRSLAAEPAATEKAALYFPGGPRGAVPRE
jgi:hypothetical protein